MLKKVLTVWAVLTLTLTPLIANGSSEDAATDEKPSLSVYVSSNVEEFPAGQDENNNFIIDFLRESTGYDLTWSVQPKDNVTEKISIMMAAGETLDLIETSDKALFAQFAYQGVLTPLDDILQTHGGNLQREIPEMTWKGVVFNRETVGIPLPQNMVDTTFGLLIRKDWLDDLGLDIPETTEELYAVMVALKEADPAGSGTIPFTGTINTFQVMQGAYGVAVEYALEGDQVVATTVSEDNRDYLEYMARCFKAGLIDPDFVVNKGGNVKEKLVGGKAAMAVVAWWDAFSIVPSTKENDQEADFIFIAPPKGPQGKSGIAAQSPIKRYFFIPAFSNKSEQAVDFLNKMTDPEIIRMINYGKEGIHHTVENGVYYPTEKINEMKWQVYYNVWDSRESFLNRVKYKGFWPYYESMMSFPQTNDIYQYAPPIEEVEAVKSTLKDLYQEYSTKIIMGVLPLEAFDEYVAKYNSMGGDKALEEIQVWYDSVK